MLHHISQIITDPLHIIIFLVSIITGIGIGLGIGLLYVKKLLLLLTNQDLINETELKYREQGSCPYIKVKDKKQG